MLTSRCSKMLRSPYKVYSSVVYRCLMTDTTDVKPLGLLAKSRLVYKKYFWPATITYSTLYLSSLAGTFIVMDMEIINAESVGIDPKDAIQTFSNLYEKLTGSAKLTEYLDANPRMATFALSCAVNELFEPLRLIAVFGFITKVLGKKE